MTEDGIERFGNPLFGELRAGLLGDGAGLGHGGVEGEQLGVGDEREALAGGSGAVFAFGHCMRKATQVWVSV